VNSPPSPLSESPPKTRWRWFNFSLKTFLIVITVVAVGMGMYAKWLRERRAAVAEVEQLQGALGIRYVGPEWLRNVVGDEKYFWDPAGVHFNRALTEAELKSVMPRLMSFRRLHDLTLHGLTDDTLPFLFPLASKLAYLDISSSQLSDDAIVHLHNFSELRTLRIGNTRVSSAGIETLRQTLPKCKLVTQ
jgi:hypothetical protein